MDLRTLLRPGRSCPLLTALLLSLLTPAASAQSLSVEVAGAGFASPLGVEIGSNGWVWVAEAGTGNDDGRVTVVTPDGQAHPFLVGLRSDSTAEGAGGVNQIRLIDGELWIAMGLSEAIPEGYLLVEDVSEWAPGDPPRTPADIDRTIDVGSAVLAMGFAQTNVYDLTPCYEDRICFTDASANAVFMVNPDGVILPLAMLPDIPNPLPGPPYISAVPTGIVEREGVVYVAAFTGFPFVSGLSRVYAIDNDTTTVYRDGLTSVTDLAVDPEDGQLVALEFAAFDLASGFLPGTGAVVKLFENGTRQTLAAGLNLTAALDLDGDDHYFTSLFGLLHRATPQVDLDASPDEILTPAPVPVSVSVTNDTDAAQTVTLRLRVVLGNQIRQLAARTVTLAPGQTVARSGEFQPGPNDRYRLVLTAEAADGTLLDSDVVTVDVQPEQAGSTPGSVASDPALDALAASWMDFDAEGAVLEAPQAARLTGSYPNPFSGATTLSIEVAEAGPVTLAVYDALGREVAVLASGAFEAGSHRVRFDAAGLPSGVYVARLTAGRVTQTHRMTLLK